MKKWFCVAFLSLCTVFSAGAARSATVSLSYSFVASNFPAGAPIDPVTGSFGLTFDDAVLGAKSLSYLNLSIDGTVYDTSNSSAFLASPGALVVGGNCSGPVGKCSTLDWGMSVLFLIGFAGELFYVSDEGDFTSRTVTLTPVAPVPLPAALPLLAAGLSALGFMGWRRKRKAVA